MKRISQSIARSLPHLLLDACVVLCSFYLALILHFDGSPPSTCLSALWILAPLIAAAFLGMNFLFGLYHCLWRYASVQEVFAIAGSVTTATLAVSILNVALVRLCPLPVATILLGGFFSMAGFVLTRYHRQLVTPLLRKHRALGWYATDPLQATTRALIVGAGEAGQLLAWRLLNLKEGDGYHLVGFIDDHPAKSGMQVHGIPVLGNRNDLPYLAAQYEVDLIIIAIYNISGDDFRAILDICQQTPCAIRVLPNLFDFIAETGKVPVLREITAEDLLGRKPVDVDREACHDLLASKTILVTGAAGSIGSELCRQILTFAPRELLMLDNNESGLYDLGVELCARWPQAPICCLVADVTNPAKLKALFQTARPEIVFHAAAYKHVPLMEEHPDEAVRVNVLGTRLLVEMATRYGTQRLVFISTDKAVNPCSVMGDTKRLGETLTILASGDRSRRTQADAEEYAALAPPVQQILFTAVRFGNVLRSRGSVVPTFERQIELGGPVTVTHPEMRRYFMSIHEAVSLVIQTAALTQGGDIFMLDMGQQIRIEDLARRLIRLRGLRPDVDVPIAYVGVRPGEKMREELVGDGEEAEPTSHPQIFRIRPGRLPEKAWFDQKLNTLIALARNQRKEELTDLLCLLVRPDIAAAAKGEQFC